MRFGGTIFNLVLGRGARAAHGTEDGLAGAPRERNAAEGRRRGRSPGRRRRPEEGCRWRTRFLRPSGGRSARAPSVILHEEIGELDEEQLAPEEFGQLEDEGDAEEEGRRDS